jgi:hypothetical protein
VRFFLSFQAEEPIQTFTRELIMYDQIQTALTITIEVIALIGFIGLPIHAIVNHHINTVRSWGTPQSMPAVEPVVEEIEPVSIAAVAPVTKLVIESVIEPIQGVLELIYEPVVEEAASDASVTVEAGGQGSGEQDVRRALSRVGEDCDRACTPPQFEHPETTGLDTHVSLRFTGTGEKGIPLPPAPFPLAYKVKQELQSVGAAAIDVHKMTARELREYCQVNKVKGYSKILKEQGTEGLRAFIGKGLK